MNIGQVLRSLIQSTPTDDAKILELKVGQVVKGMVLQLLGEQDALININGVQLKAKLETPLKQGEVTMLQVQSESAKGQIILKPLGSSGIQITENSLSDMLEDFGVKDHTSNRQLVQLLHQEKVPLSKDNVKSFVNIASQPPQNMDEEEWKQTALITIKRGLPLSTESVKSLHQALFGKPMTQTLSQFSQQINDSLHTNKFISPQVKEMMHQVKQLVDHLIETSHEPFLAKFISPNEKFSLPILTTTEDNQSKPPVVSAAKPSQGSTLDKNSTILQQGDTNISESRETHSTGSIAKVQSNQNTTVSPTLTFQDEENMAPEHKATFPSTVSQLRNTTEQIGLLKEQILKPALGILPPLDDVQQQNQDTAAKEVEDPKTDQNSDVKEAKAAIKEGTAFTASPQKQDSQWIPKLLKTIGMEHEQQLFKLMPNHEQAFHKAAPNTDLLNLPSQMDSEIQQADPDHPAQTLKGALLSLFATEGLPSAVKESTQQLVQQITGQQLLLSPDRTSMFSHITLMLPLPNQSGLQSSAVHIQSRQGNRGELDANNCRLLFDLRMQSIGSTLVDVHVVDRIVSVHVHNEHPIVAQLLESQRNEIESSLHDIGYQFLSLKCSPYPDQTAQNTADSEATKQDSGKSSFTSLYSSKPYKGVDIRV